MNKLYVRTIEQKTLFDKELKGQLSDGHWENEETDERLWDCDVIVAKEGEKLGCNFSVLYYADFADPDIDFLWSRMIEYVRNVNSDYTEEKLISDLHELTKIVYNTDKEGGE